jgi:hypothetical protein
MSMNRLTTLGMICAATLAFSVSAAMADEPEPQWLAFDDGSQQPSDGQTKSVTETQTTTEKPAEWEKPLPMSLTLQYVLVSDYIFRGINFSEYDREGRERLNHQMSTSLSLDLAALCGKPAGQCGEIGFDTWFGWFAGQKEINPTTGANIQEVDYTVWYSYNVEKLATEVKVGWVDYVYPNVVGVSDNDRTNEWFFTLTHNDAWMWRSLGYTGEDGILNPTVCFYHDMHINRGAWTDFCINHPFEIVKNLTFTPSYMLHVDMGWSGALSRDSHGSDDHDTRVAGMTYGLDLTYDLTEALHLPPWAGTMAVSGFLNWFDPTSAFRHYGPTLGVQDELYGGMKLSWSW